MAKVKKTIDEKIDDLAQSVARGFAHMDDKFAAVDKRFDAIDERLDRIEFSVNAHERRFEILEDKVQQIAVKVGLRFN